MQKIKNKKQVKRHYEKPLIVKANTTFDDLLRIAVSDDLPVNDGKHASKKKRA